MDLSTVIAAILTGAICLLVGRRFGTSLGRSSAVMGSLFVPYDGSLGWPRGVQESDEPWAWRTPDPEPSVETSAVPSVPVRRVR